MPVGVRTRRNLLVVVGLVVLCLAVDYVAFRNVQSYALASGASLHGLFFAIFIPFTLAVPGLWYLIFVRKIRQELVFLLAAVAFGLILMLVRTPYTWFDENKHVYLALYYADVALGAEHGVTEDGMLTWTGRAEDANSATLSSGAFNRHRTTADDYRLAFDHFFELEQNPGKTTTLTVAKVGVFYQYLPPTLGVTVAHLLHLGKVPTLYLAKLFSLAFFIFMMYLAIKTAPRRFKTLFVLLGLMPFVLSSAGTFSYDNVINVLAFFFVASVLRLACETRQARIRDIVLLAALGVLLAPLKYVYLPLVVLLPLIVPRENWPQPHFRLFWCVGILALGLAAIGIFSFARTSAFIFQETAEPILAEHNPTNYTLKTFFEQPATALKIFIYSAIQHLGLLVDTSTGFTFSRQLPLWASYLMFFFLILNSDLPANNTPKSARADTVDGDREPSAANIDRGPFSIDRRVRLVLLAIALVIYVLVLLASVSWTPVEYAALAGVQGRYFIPLLPLLALTASGFTRPGPNSARVSIYLFCCLSGLETFLSFVAVF
jgi:hypothetical protein